MMFLFTNYVTSPIERYDMGFYFVFFIAANIVVNLLILVIIIGKAAYKAIKTKYKIRQFKKAMA